jgi:hypothetical protein
VGNRKKGVPHLGIVRHEGRKAVAVLEMCGLAPKVRFSSERVILGAQLVMHVEQYHAAKAINAREYGRVSSSLYIRS